MIFIFGVVVVLANLNAKHSGLTFSYLCWQILIYENAKTCVVACKRERQSGKRIIFLEIHHTIVVSILLRFIFSFVLNLPLHVIATHTYTSCHQLAIWLLLCFLSFFYGLYGICFHDYDLLALCFVGAPSKLFLD